EARSSSGHLFTSLSVSATTLCSSCNKSITAKEALSCPGCNVTIHNRCRDSVASCAKMKQRQQKLTLVRNNSALQNVALRTKTPMMKERPSSAIYPSDTLRQSLLGSRRVRSGLTLAKSVSTNNIAGGTEEVVGLRRILSQSTESLNFRNRTLSMESLTDEADWWWNPLLEELQKEGCCISADSWSLAVDSKFLQTLHKDTIKQQDVIYELIQTEFHHVRTLRIMEGVYRRGMQEEVMLEAGVVHTIFPCLDQLLEFHSSFLSQLLDRRKEGLMEGSSNNFTVRRLGDLLLRQFSGQCAEDMKKLYSEFCSRHPKAVKLYKEVLNRDRRLQQFIRRVCRGPLLRRHGVQECILLVTQRLTKYPVLIQRILDNTKGCPEELQDLEKALTLLKELIGSVDQEVLELDRNRRLQEIQARLDPRAQAEVKGGGAFRGGELLRRKLLHEGTLTWKVQGSRMKDVQVLLMSDILVFLQEKDQKFTFASLEKSPVVSLTKLIVREVANQEKGMYLISDSTPPEMYEVYASSKDDRKTWMSSDIQQKDKEVLELLQERATLFSDLVQATARGEAGEEKSVEVKPPSSNRNLFRADTPHAPKAEPLLLAAIGEGKQDLGSDLLAGAFHEGSPSFSVSVDKLAALLTDSSTQKSSVTNGNQDIRSESRSDVTDLSVGLHPQAAVIRQDSILELTGNGGPTPPAAPGSAPGPRLVRSMSRDAALDASGEAVLLRRQVELLQEELSRLRVKAEERRRRTKEKVTPTRTNRCVPKGQVNNGDDGDEQNGADVNRVSLQVNKKAEEPEPQPFAPLAIEDPVDQLDGLEEGNEEEEEEVMKISPRSDSPRGSYQQPTLKLPIAAALPVTMVTTRCHPQTCRTSRRRLRANLPAPPWTWPA
uniref:Rho/rac guanine nucleotide exchange factor (GEF) 2b n=1 Tax=Cyprinodon variegatus TaxID=28743 RepID=A0A3Q2G9Z3_CYPVA